MKKKIISECYCGYYIFESSTIFGGLENTDLHMYLYHCICENKSSFAYYYQWYALRLCTKVRMSANSWQSF